MDNDIHKIDLKFSLNDSLASAANYINRMGWKKSQPCFFRVKLTNKLEVPFFNTGKTKQWQKELDQKTINIFEKKFEKEMRELNYI